MKKLLVIISGIALFTCASYSSLHVTWTGPAGFVGADGVRPLLQIGTTTNYGSAFAIIVFSASGAYYNDNLVEGSFTIGDEIILDTQIISYVGDEYGPVFSQTFNTNFMAGYMYARVFDVGTTPNPASVTNGLWYYQGPITQTVDNTSILPTYHYIHRGTAGFPPPFEDADRLDRQVVPEPATLAILALGGAVVAVRRKIRA